MFITEYFPTIFSENFIILLKIKNSSSPHLFIFGPVKWISRRKFNLETVVSWIFWSSLQRTTLSRATSFISQPKCPEQRTLRYFSIVFFKKCFAISHSKMHTRSCVCVPTPTCAHVYTCLLLCLTLRLLCGFYRLPKGRKMFDQSLNIMVF